MSSEIDVIANSREPITHDAIVTGLQNLGVEPGDILIVHISMSALGWVIGGAQTVVESLLEAVGAAGSVVMPAQSSHLGDPMHWADPPVPHEWFETIRDNMPAYDARLTPTRGVGAVAECFRHHPRAVRSRHPLSSFSAVGPHAEEITANHALAPGLGEGSPLSLLYELDAKVLLIGVGHDRNTSLHLAEHRAQWPGKVTGKEAAPIVRNGQREWVTYKDLVLDDEDFILIGNAYAKLSGLRPGRVAGARSGLFNQRELVDFAVDWMNTHRAQGYRKLK